MKPENIGGILIHDPNYNNIKMEVLGTQEERILYQAMKFLTEEEKTIVMKRWVKQSGLLDWLERTHKAIEEKEEIK